MPDKEVKQSMYQCNASSPRINLFCFLFEILLYQRENCEDTQVAVTTETSNLAAD